jgi:hypothetical protein
MTREPKTVRGRLVLVHEQAFRLVTPDGRAIHLTLGAHGYPFPRALTGYRDAGIEVEVEYEGEPGTTTGKATFVRPV